MYKIYFDEQQYIRLNPEIAVAVNDLHTLDHLDNLSRSDKHSNHNQYVVNIENIEEVDYFWQGQPLSELIGKK